MIYTVTFNPSLDYIVTTEDFRLGITNRTTSEQILPGGKGINVSMVLQNLGIKSTVLGFTAGFVGEEIERRVREFGCQARFIRIPEGNSRINVKLKSIEGTEINGRGPQLGNKEKEELFARLLALKNGDILVLAGSIPAGMPQDIYSEIMQHIEKKRVKVVVDATKQLLVNTLQYHPFLIKPNVQEVGQIFGLLPRTKQEVIPYARKLKEFGAQNVLVSMAEAGAVLIDARGNCHMLDAPEGKLVNGVGAGDSMVAGFLAGWKEKKDYNHAFKMAVAAGSASAFSEVMATGEEIRQLYEQMSEKEKRVGR